MVFFVYSSIDKISSGIAGALKNTFEFQNSDNINGMGHFYTKDINLLEIDRYMINAEFLDQTIKTDLIIFLSRHRSAKEIASFTTHAEGNWTENAELGGLPRKLSVASPINMLKMLKALSLTNKTEIPVTYEATHHGPFLSTPSLFVEIGGSDAITTKVEFEILARSIVEMLSTKTVEYEKIAIGVGGTHYPERFTKLALSGKYAFSHIMSKYNVENVDMLQQAVERSDVKPEIAVVEWKSIKSVDRDKIINRLNDLGLDYEKS